MVAVPLTSPDTGGHCGQINELPLLFGNVGLVASVPAINLISLKSDPQNAAYFIYKCSLNRISTISVLISLLSDSHQQEIINSDYGCLPFGLIACPQSHG